MTTITEHHLTAAKVKFALALVLCLLALLAGCNPTNPRTPEQEIATGGDVFQVYTDPLTGCEYLRPIGYAGITPRLDRDGKQFCDKVKP